MDYFGLALLLGISLLFGFLAYRAFRARRVRLKFAGGIPAALLALLSSAGIWLALVGYSQLTAPRPNPVPQLSGSLTLMHVVAAALIVRALLRGCQT